MAYKNILVGIDGSKRADRAFETAVDLAKVFSAKLYLVWVVNRDRGMDSSFGVNEDFYQDFADSLSLLDEVILVDIYPAREAPIPGVTSKLIYDNLRPGIEKSMCKKEDILNILKDKNIEVLITLGAGDIDNYVPEIKELLETKKLRMNNEE